MYIEPNTDIRILKNCPCDADYTNTLYFASKTTQANYFVGLTKYNLSNYSYQRVNKGVLRVGIQAENLYDCNYMMFRNNAFGEKWFYAFIDKVEYVNNSMSEVFFTIDVMQTWITDYTVNQTFVEREHSVTDVVGENLVPESLNLGEYTIEDIEQPYEWNDLEKVIVIGSTDWHDEDGWHEGTDGGVIGGVFSGIHFEIIEGNNAEIRADKASDYLAPFSEEGKVDSILGVWETYSQYVTQGGYNSFIDTQRGLTLHGYSPKNKKLLTFPYTFIEGSTPDGNRHSYLYEFFNDPDNIRFHLRGSFNGTASLVMYPSEYKDVSRNYDESMGYESASVQCAYTVDSFKAWLAQNSYHFGHIGDTKIQLPKTIFNQTFAGGVAGAKLAGGEGALFGATAGALHGIADVLQKGEVTPNQGTLGSGSAVNHILREDIFKLYRKAITPEFALKIDQYFNRYGYATNNIKVPNTHSRPHWNYVKTIGCTINGSLPADDEKKICAIFDNGVTFWKNGSEVGNYSLNNSPT